MKNLYTFFTIVLLAATANAQTFLNPSFESNNVGGQSSMMSFNQVEDTVDNVYGISGDFFRMHSTFTSICDSNVAYNGTWYFGTTDSSSAFAMELDQTANVGTGADITFYARNCTTSTDIIVGLSTSATSVGTPLDTLTISAPTSWTMYSISSLSIPADADYVTIRTLNGTFNEIDFDAFDYQVTISVPEILKEDLQINLYPNPAINNVQVTAGKIIQQIEITNAIGQQVIALSPNAKQVTIDVEGLPSGMYVVKAAADNASTTQKLLVK